MKALITGINGFVGEHLSRLLLQNGDEVYGTIVEGSFVNPAVPIHTMDITNAEETARVIASIRPEVIYHLAGFSNVGLSWKRPALTFDVNVKGTVNLLEAVRACGIADSVRILVIGSSEQYGMITPAQCPVSELVPLSPTNPYAISKGAQEQLATLYHKAYGLHTVMVRAFNHIGPMQAAIFVVSDFCRQVAEIERGLHEPILRVGNLAAIRDFTDVRDIVRAYSLLTKHGVAGEIYNVGQGSSRSVQSILDTILSQASVPIQVEVDPAKLRPIDMPIVEADTAKLKAATGWQPEIPLEQTIADTLAYWRATIQA